MAVARPTHRTALATLTALALTGCGTTDHTTTAAHSTPTAAAGRMTINPGGCSMIDPRLAAEVAGPNTPTHGYTGRAPDGGRILDNCTINPRKSPSITYRVEQLDPTTALTRVRHATGPATAPELTTFNTHVGTTSSGRTLRTTAGYTAEIDFATGPDLVTVAVYGQPTATNARTLAERFADNLNQRLSP